MSIYFIFIVLILASVLAVLMYVSAFLIFVGLFLYKFQQGSIKIPALGTKGKDIDRLLKDEKITNKDVLIDLGAGIGGTLFKIERATRCRTYGYEMSVVPFLLSKIFVFIHNSKSKIYFKNFLQADISSATIVYTYLGKEIMSELEPLFINQLKPGSRVISCDFTLPNIKPSRIFSYTKHTFYIYVF